MSLITSRDLHIYRGTYKECMSQATEDMKFYFAWDTGEFFIGNKRGIKVKYGGSGLKKEEVERIADEKIAEFKTYQADIIINYVKNYLDSNGDIHELTIRMDQIESDLQKLQDSINALTGGNLDLLKELSGLPARVETIESENQTIKSDITDLNTRLDTEISDRKEEIKNYYTKAETDSAIQKKVNGFLNADALKEYAKTTEVDSKIDNVKIELTTEINKKSSVIANPNNETNKKLDKVSIDGEIFKLAGDVDLTGCIQGILGSDLAIGIADKSLNGLFIVTEESGAYLIGTIWSVKNGNAVQISSGSGGEITKKDITTTLSLNANYNYSQEINSQALSITFTWQSSNNQNGCALDRLTFSDSTGVQQLTYNEEANAVSSGTLVRALARNVIGSKSFTLNGTCKKDTTTIDYTVNPESVVRTFTVYQPSFICVNEYTDNNQLHKEQSLNNKTFTMDVELNDKVSIYVPTGKTASTNDIYTPIEKVGTVNLTINGIVCSYDKYQTNALAKDNFNITILIQ